MLDTVKVDHVIGHAVKNGLDHHLEHDARERRTDAAVRAQSERDVVVGRAVQQHLTRAFELLLIVVGRDPADEDPLVAPKLLARKDSVTADGAAQLFVDREVAQKFICRGAIQIRTVDELPSQIRVCAEVQQAERGQRCRGVDPAADEVPEDVDELGVVKSPAVELELDEEAR